MYCTAPLSTRKGRLRRFRNDDDDEYQAAEHHRTLAGTHRIQALWDGLVKENVALAHRS